MNHPLPDAPFFSATIDATAPLWLWALHFFASYALTAAGCELAWDPSVLRAGLLAGSAAAIALAAWCFIRACRLRQRAASDLLATARLASSALALVGIVWATLPLLMLPACPPA